MSVTVTPRPVANPRIVSGSGKFFGATFASWCRRLEVPTATLDIDPQIYYSSAAQCVSACNIIADGLIALGRSLGSSGSMAGSDPGGREWGTDYDAGAAGLFDLANQITAAAGNYADLLTQGGINHATAESDASIAQTSPASMPSLPHAQVVNVAPPPSSVGDSGPGLQNAIDLAAAVGVPCPNGNTDVLDATARAWAEFGQIALAARKELLSAAGNMYGGIQSPEIGAIYRELRQIAESCQSLYSASIDTSTSCRAHAEGLRTTRSEIVDAIEQFAIEEAAAIVLGIGLSFLTAGVSAAASAAIAAGRFVSTANKVKSIIESLRAALGMNRLGEKAADARRAAGELEEIASRPVVDIYGVPRQVRPRPRSRFTADDEAKYQRYLERKERDGAEPRDRDDWKAAADRLADNKASGDDFRDFVFEDLLGYQDNVDGWGRETPFPTPHGPRAFDIANDELREAIEVKNGEIGFTDDIMGQIAKDEWAVSQGWSVTWAYRDTALVDPRVLQRLDDLSKRYPGNFNYGEISVMGP